MIEAARPVNPFGAEEDPVRDGDPDEYRANEGRRGRGRGGEEWEDPAPLPDGLPPVAEFDPEMLPGPLRAWVLDISERMQVPPDYCAAGAVVVAAGDHVIGYDLGTGARRWEAREAAGCTDGFTTGGGMLVCPAAAYDAVSGTASASWPPGPFTPLGCEVASSGCAGFRDGRGHGWLAGAAVPRRAADLDAPGSTVAAGAIVTVTDDEVAGRSATGARWRRPGTAQLLGGAGGTVLLLTPERTLIGLDADTGAEAFRFKLGRPAEKTDWKPGLYQVTEHYLALERLHRTAGDDPESPTYYQSLDAVMIAGY